MSDTLYYSAHAEKRCLERGISERNIHEAICYGELVWSDEGKATYVRGRLRVIVSPGGRIVTAFREKKRNPKRNIQRGRQKWRKMIRKAARGAL